MPSGQRVLSDIDTAEVKPLPGGLKESAPAAGRIGMRQVYVFSKPAAEKFKVTTSNPDAIEWASGIEETIARKRKNAEGLKAESVRKRMLQDLDAAQKGLDMVWKLLDSEKFFIFNALGLPEFQHLKPAASNKQLIKWVS